MVDRQTRCILGWKVAWERSAETIQQIVDDAPKAKEYFSDGWEAYAMLWYHLGYYQVSVGKSDTYSVEADNAELRHYLARLARSSRCFSRCPQALECALRLFVYCFNSRQLYKQQYPIYSAHVSDFISPPFNHSGILKVNPQSVVNWVKRYTEGLPNAPVPKRPKVAELDELFTYVGQKKRNLRFDGGGSGNALCLELGRRV